MVDTEKVLRFQKKTTQPQVSREAITEDAHELTQELLASLDVSDEVLIEQQKKKKKLLILCR
jgi:hypothetical protein